jgi:hypothetical protein
MSARHSSPDTSAPSTGPFIVAIGSQNNFIHVYPDERALLADHDIGAGVGESHLPLEFFDGEGRRLAGVYDGRWHLLRLVPTAESADLDGVRQRVESVLAYLRSFVEQHPDIVRLYGLTQEEALGLFATPRKGKTLLDSLLPFSAGGTEDGFFGGVAGDEDDQGIIHNITHHGHF